MGVALFAPHSADAARKKKPEAAAAEPVAIEQPIPLEPAGLDFGKTAKEVTAIYSKAIDKDYGKAYTEVEPGTEQRRLDEEVQREKDAFKKSILVLDAPPSNMDGTRFVGEFTYGNAEAVMRSVRQGKERTLFFIGDKLWKVIDIYELAEKSKMGADFKSAVAHIEKMTGVPGRSRAANPEQGRRFDEVDWANAKIHLRLIHWDEKKVAVAFVERATAARLSELRAHKEKPPVDMDPAVKGVLR
ncbi:MAG: hypothetical protein EXR75_02550 [Myxococcales bacterium]|nr:hypothetical protein [Myxococcales bacterium]